MSEEIVRKLLTNKKKILFESTDISNDEELLLDTEEDPGMGEEEIISRLVQGEEVIPTEEVEEDKAVEYEPCVCGSTKVAMEDGHAVCDECGRELSVRELGEPLVPSIRHEEVEESNDANDKTTHLKSVLAVWNSGKYQRAMELCRRYGISDREFAFALVKSFRESDELVDALEDALNEGAFKVFHYEIISKDSGRVIIKNFGYFDDENSFWKNMNSQYPKKKFIVKMTKPIVKTNESVKIKEETLLAPPESNEDTLDKKIIRAIHTPMTTADKPDLDAAIMEAFSKKIEEAADVDTSRWSNANRGRKPSGYGMWWFKIGNDEVDFSGMYADAKKKAIQYATQKGVQRIILLT